MAAGEVIKVLAKSQKPAAIDRERQRQDGQVLIRGRRIGRKVLSECDQLKFPERFAGSNTGVVGDCRYYRDQQQHTDEESGFNACAVSLPD